MYARKLLAATVTAAVTASALALTAGSASAAVDPNDTTFTPVASDLIAVGSDTTQGALKLLAESYNGQTPAPAFRIATFAATGGGQITLPGGAINRPNGSGSGKALLYGAGNNPDVDFARSSSAQSTAETAAGLQSFPFALDTLTMVVSNSVPSNAPASLTPAQIVEIYKGNITNWNQIPGGTAGTIAPKTPQPGSGTRSFWDSQLKIMNNGVAVTYGASVTEVQEHDDSQIKNDPNAIAPFSVGRAELLGTTLRLENGYKADRAVYNVVRGADVGRADVLSVLGEDGFFCSIEARPLIEDAGFSQLATPDFGGVCGEPTQAATSNFTLNERVVTTTTLTVTSPSARTARLAAVVTGSTSPQGTVSFFDGETPLAANVPLTSGQAVATLSNVAPGAHTYTAVFTPAEGSFFDASEDTGAGTVKASSKISETFAATVKAGKRAKGTITVVLTGISAKASGKVKVLKGAKTIASKSLVGGKATITLPKLKAGVNKLKIVWGGNGVAVGSTKTFTIKQLK
jgi:ABC-type phosphate transport system substrate-binding protein